MLKYKDITISKVFSALFAVILMTIGIIFTLYFISVQKKLLHDELKQRGILLVQNLSQGSVLGIARNDLRLMRELTRSASQDKEIEYAEVLTIDLQPIVRSGVTDFLPVSRKTPLMESKGLYVEFIREKNLYDVFYPVLLQSEQQPKNNAPDKTEKEQEAIEQLIGFARVGISAVHIDEKIFHFAVKSFLITIFMIIAVTFILYYFIHNLILQPLRKLTLAAVTISHGDLRQEVDIDFNNEIGVLGKAFNMMVNELRDLKTKLEQTTYKLDDKIKDRTKELDDHAAELKEQLQQLHVHQKRTMQFIAAMFRELRSPLMAISGFTSTLERSEIKDNPAKQAHYMSVIENETFRMTALVDHLYDLYYSDSKSLEIIPRAVTCSSLIEHAVEVVQKKFPAMIFEKKISEQKLQITADEALIKKVFVELLYNAAKYSPPQGIVSIACSPEGKTVVFSVSDSGIGIPDEEHEKVFQRFYRIDNTVNRKYPGSGLGLTVVSAIVTAHRGTVTMKKNTRGGLEVLVRIPIDITRDE